MISIMDNVVFPCAIFAYNRPEKFKQVLRALRSQPVEKLIIFIDGPRDDKDIFGVEKCRRIANKVDWTKTELHFADENKGLISLLENIDTVFRENAAAIFLEDDCLPMPSFCNFMHKALRYYENDKQVFSIAGYQPLHPDKFRNYEPSLVSFWRFSAWGWATWQDRWLQVRPLISKFFELFDDLTQIPDIAGHDIAGMARKVRDGRTQSWGIRVAIATLYLRMAHLTPTSGLIKNIGILGKGVHSGPHLKHSAAYHNLNLQKKSEVQPIMWLESVEPLDFFTWEFQEFMRSASSGKGVPNRKVSMASRLVKRFGSLLGTGVKKMNEQ